MGAVEQQIEQQSALAHATPSHATPSHATPSSTSSGEMMASSGKVDGIMVDGHRASFTRALRTLLKDARIRSTMVGLFGTGWVREGFLSWLSDYLVAVAGIRIGSPTHSATALSITLCGALGSLSVGIISDRCCHARRAPVVLGCAIGQALVLMLFPLLIRASAPTPGASALTPEAGSPTSTEVSLSPEVDTLTAFMSIALCGLLSAPLFGALTLLMAAASVELVPPALSGTASGLLNGAQYIGSGLSAFAGGVTVEFLGWDALMAQLAFGAILSCTGMGRLMWLQRTTLPHLTRPPVACRDIAPAPQSQVTTIADDEVMVQLVPDISAQEHDTPHVH
eukprot:CAMPEP_0174698430 /NCGR_PEP_ID=MMETSP1094-20130205/4034_1 /TAXON_ID=156173 /ORGANISM="Chrysochromulina brevifilum, Strain UTEX LB 985" /LENGTH=337 /DNA_ID=CAMNT_0015895609 /DNA_START=139 /DNA_END=1152 /DNA_ORIENTATION=-